MIHDRSQSRADQHRTANVAAEATDPRNYAPMACS
jgi:hypothetical protein